MTVTKMSPATKYRVAVRQIAVDNGWTFSQTSAATDRFSKGSTTVDVHHSPSHLISNAEIATPKGLDTIKGSGKMFEVQAVLTGVADPDHSHFIRLSGEQVVKFESGQGIAKIAAAATAPRSVPASKPVNPVSAVKAVSSPKPRTPRKPVKASAK